MYDDIDGKYDIIENNVKNQSSYTSLKSLNLKDYEKGKKVVYKRERFMSENGSHPSFQIINYGDLEIETNYTTGKTQYKKDKKSDIYVNNNILLLSNDQLGFKNDYKVDNIGKVNKSDFNKKIDSEYDKDYDMLENDEELDLETSIEINLYKSNEDEKFKEKSDNDLKKSDEENNYFNENNKCKCANNKKKINIEEVKEKANQLKDLLNKNRKHTL